jgi:hypothetical protein
MYQTLRVIPHQWLGAPLLYAWLAAGLIALIVIAVRQGFGGTFANTLGMFVVGFIVIRFVIPQIEILGIDMQNPDGPLIIKYIFLIPAR